jgi:hypothetical protein
VPEAELGPVIAARVGDEIGKHRAHGGAIIGMEQGKEDIDIGIAVIGRQSDQIPPAGRIEGTARRHVPAPDAVIGLERDQFEQRTPVVVGIGPEIADLGGHAARVPSMDACRRQGAGHSDIPG